jgi:hypothetical protein
VRARELSSLPSIFLICRTGMRTFTAHTAATATDDHTSTSVRRLFAVASVCKCLCACLACVRWVADGRIRARARALLLLLQAGRGVFEATVPASAVGATGIEYYVQAQVGDGGAATVVWPAGAPDLPHTVIVVAA